ncbi:amidohydrolase family protein [bacterium]|nr:amidohydrolase family protein [bacterium]
MIIDMNTYIGSLPYWQLRHNDADGLVGQMDRAGIERAFVSSTRGYFTYSPDGNDETLAACAKHPDRLWPALTFNPYPNGLEYRGLLDQPGPKIVKLMPQHQNFVLSEEPGIAEMIDTCGQKGIPVMLVNRMFTSQRIGAASLPAYKAYILQHPKTQFIIATFNYLFEMQSAIDILRCCPNAYAETSGMMGLNELEIVVREVGADRILHGSGMILQMPAEVGPLRVRSARIGDKEKDQILSGNAIKLFNLKSAAAQTKD